MEIQNRELKDKTLYVCVNNVGRSQMGAALHNNRLPGYAESAGLRVDRPGGLVKEWEGGAGTICDVMDELSPELSIANKRRIQFDPERAKLFGRTIFLLSPEQMLEKFSVDDFDDEKKLYWPMDDPRDMLIEDVRRVREQIARSVCALIDKVVEVMPIEAPN